MSVVDWLRQMENTAPGLAEATDEDNITPRPASGTATLPAINYHLDIDPSLVAGKQGDGASSVDSSPMPSRDPPGSGASWSFIGCMPLDMTSAASSMDADTGDQRDAAVAMEVDATQGPSVANLPTDMEIDAAPGQAGTGPTLDDAKPAAPKGPQAEPVDPESSTVSTGASTAEQRNEEGQVTGTGPEDTAIADALREQENASGSKSGRPLGRA